MLIPKLSNIFVYSCDDKYTLKDKKRFCSKIKIDYKTGNFEWIGTLNKGGYGIFVLCKNGKPIPMLAHRAAIEMATGILISNDLFACHKNDNPPDVNPDHLFLGTNKDNMTDRNNKGRQVKGCVGENGTHVKHTWEKINNVRRDWLSGNYSMLKLAKKYNIHIGSMQHIIDNITWYDSNYIPVKFGRKGGNAKLVIEQVIEIHRLNAIGRYTNRQIAEKIGVDRSTIGLILNNKIKRWINYKTDNRIAA